MSVHRAGGVAMSDITEAIGTAAEGGLLSKAVSKDGAPIEKPNTVFIILFFHFL